LQLLHRVQRLRLQLGIPNGGARSENVIQGLQGWLFGRRSLVLHDTAAQALHSNDFKWLMPVEGRIRIEKSPGTRSASSPDHMHEEFGQDTADIPSGKSVSN
jgi:hypothetical protein